MPWDVTNTLGRQYHYICGLDHSVILRGWGGDTKTLPYTREGWGTPLGLDPRHVLGFSWVLVEHQ